MEDREDDVDGTGEVAVGGGQFGSALQVEGVGEGCGGCGNLERLAAAEDGRSDGKSGIVLVDGSEGLGRGFGGGGNL